MLLLTYSGSYWYLRAKTIYWEDIFVKSGRNYEIIPYGYYFHITLGVGLGGDKGPGVGAYILPYRYSKGNIPVLKNGCIISITHSAELKLEFED